MQLSDSEHITNAMLLQHERIAAAGVHLRLLLLRNRLSACWPNPLYLPVRFGSSSAVLFTFHMNLITPLIGLCAYTLTFCVDVATSWSTPPSILHLRLILPLVE